MNAIDTIAQNGVFGSLGDGTYNFIDADTLRDKDGKDYRIQGIDAPEITNYFGGIKEGTAGGTAAFETISALANKQGFTKIIKTGEMDSTGKRELVDLQDDQGRSFRQMLFTSGIFEPTKYTKMTDRIAYDMGRNSRENGFFGEKTQDDWTIAKSAIEAGIADETVYAKQFKATALDEADLAQANKLGLGHLYNQSDVQMRNFDRDLENKSNSPFSTSLSIGLQGVQESMYGLTEMLGDTTGVDWISDIGENGIKRVRNRLADGPKVITDYKDVDGFWGKDGAVRYLTNNAAMSLPYMAITMASAALSPGLGISLIAPSMIYAGQVYAEQEGDNKNATAAIAGGIAQGTLDRLGLQALAPRTLLTKAGRDLVINRLMVDRNMTKEAAKELLGRMSRLEVANASKTAANFAKEQLKKTALAKNLLKRVGVGAVGEGTTEAMQEAIGYTAANTAENFRDWNPDEFINRIQQAAVAGTSLGSAFAAPGSIYDAGVWADIGYRKAPASAKAKSIAGQRGEKDFRKFGHQINIQDRNNEIDSVAKAAKATGTMTDFNERVDAENDRKKTRNLSETGKDMKRALPGFWRGQVRHLFNEDIISKSDTARWLSEAFGGSLQRSTTGASYENYKHHEITKLRNIVGPVNEIMHNFGIRETRKNRQTFSDAFYDAARQALANAKTQNRRKIRFSDLPADARTPEMRRFLTQLNDMSEAMWKMQKKHNPKLGHIQDYLLKYKSFNVEAIEGNKEGFVQALVDNYGVDHTKGRELADAIINMDGVNDIDDAFSVTDRKSFSPSSHKKRSFGISEKAAFNEFMEKDLFNNISNAGKSAVRYASLNEYTGANNEKLELQLDSIEQELIRNGMRPQDAKEETNRLAHGIKDYLDAESGNYKRIKNPIIEGAQKNLLFVTTITSLPLATLSNFVEVAMVSRGLTKDQIFGKNGLKETGKTFGREMGKVLKDVGRATINRKESKPTDPKGTVDGVIDPITGKPKLTGHGELRKLGYLDWEVGAAHTTGVTEVNKWQQRFLDWFFKFILLQQWTNATRASRAAIAGDFFSNHLSIIKESRDEGAVYTNEVAESYEFMRNLGGDIEFIIDHQESINPTQAESQKYDDMIRDMTFNFINEAVVLPQSANRPKIFQDPRFAMFTQFQGFISTFTANHIPKLWGEYVKRGSPAMKYNAFALMATMIALGFASQHLKDLIKYGGETPYLEGSDYVRRGIGASGLLGTGERVLDFMFPIYEERYSNPITWTMGTVSGESAAITKVGTVGDIAVNTLEGDTAKRNKDLLRLSPINRFINNIYNNVNWNFGG